MGGTEGNGLDTGLAQLELNDVVPMATPPAPPDSFRDITKEFFEESKKLNVGQLVKDPYFTLLQSVGALEIMDPKMDSGMLEAEYESFDCLKPRLPEEIIGIMDSLFTQEMAWHTGSSLSQTVFTCLYVDRLLSSNPISLDEAVFTNPGPDNEDGGALELLEKVLRPYCLGVIKCCGCVNDQILMEHIYEEEDFVTQTYNISLLEYVDPADVISLLNEAIVWVDGAKSTLSDEIYTALMSRLVLRRYLLLDFSKGAENWHAGAEPQWSRSLVFLSDIDRSHSLGKPVPEAWSMSVQRKLASQVPPRPNSNRTFAQAVADLTQLCREMNDILRILEFESGSNQMTYFLHLSARKPPPLAYSRSLLQSLFNKDMKILGRLSVKDILFDDLKELCCPIPTMLDPTNDAAEAPHSAPFQIKKRTDWFVERAGQSYINLYRIICQNRSRLRRNLCHSILDWDSLHVEAEEVDAELRNFTGESPIMTQDGPAYAFCLSSWVYHYKLRQMEWIILLGFELEVFLPHEFAGMYWYLQHYLRMRIGHVERILQFVPAPSPDRRRKKGKENPPPPDPEQRSISLLNYHLLEATAMQDLAGAMANLYVALGRLDLLSKPEQPYSTDTLRYELRMKPFISIGCPEVIPFDMYQAAVDKPELSTAELLDYAAGAIAEARKSYGHIGDLDAKTARAVLCEDAFRLDVRKMIRSCIGVGVAVAVLAKALKAGKASKADLDVSIDREKYHPFFPVPSITQRKT